jgi:penicillin-binding protein 1A
VGQRCQRNRKNLVIIIETVNIINMSKYNNKIGLNTFDPAFKNRNVNKKDSQKKKKKPAPPKFFGKILKNGSLALASLLLSAFIILGCVYSYLALRLPDVSQLRDVQLQVPLRVYSSDGKLIAEFGEKKRVPVTIQDTPKLLIDGILDTEDQRFFEHSGVDLFGLVRAAKIVFLTGKKSQGASTITMQVARNFFLSRDKTYGRKLNEILLAIKIDQEFTKNEILELYLNKIYLGQRTYGVAAAAQLYFGKNLNQLTVAELALLAGLPQAPSRGNPLVNPKGAIERRNHVLMRMYENKHINIATYKAAIAEPLNVTYHEPGVDVQAPYVAEMVRAAMVQQFGSDVYDKGYKIYTTIDSHLQELANNSLRQGILAYDRRHGYRGPEKNLGSPREANFEAWRKQLNDLPLTNVLLAAAVTAENDSTISALLANGNIININKHGWSWAGNNSVKIGDVIRVNKNPKGEWQLTQIPKVEGALAALNPNNGAILALIGGFSYAKSNFNRATQSDRQTGSALKPFIYSAALNKGFTLASLVNDAPIVIAQAGTNIVWRPQNDNLNFTGPTRLRVGLSKSRNLVSIRLLQAIGIPYAIEYLQNFGFAANQLPATPALALGTAGINPTQMAAAYATFANGGYKVTPYFINTIKDSNDKVVFQAQPLVVPTTTTTSTNINPSAQQNFAPRTITPQNAYLINDALKDVIRSGTATSALILHRSDLAGKTGTTNNQSDAWFCGFNGDLSTSVWIGFDHLESVYEHGAQAALPIWTDFMGQALQGKTEHSMAEPEGIVTAKIDPRTGLLASPGQKNAIFEMFSKDTAPKQTAPTSDNATTTTNEEVEENSTETTEQPATGTTKNLPPIVSPNKQSSSETGESEPLF